MKKKSLHPAQNQQGVAILMVITSIAILAFILADFTFETKVNKLKIYNGQDKLQARLNAEAGLNFALSKLRIYQEARNLLEKNESLKGVVQPSQIEAILLEPFIYPIPALPGMGAIQRSALADFSSTIIFNGEVTVQMSAVSGFLNPNNMRLAPLTAQEQEEPTFFRDNDDDGAAEKSPQLYMEETLLETLVQALEKKNEEDEDFALKYGNLDPALLIKELKFYVSDPKLFEDPERAEIEAQYLAANITPKHAPLTSIDELYSLIGWPDDIVNLIKDQLTVHEVSIIAVNELTEDQLKVLFPDITPFQIEEFFRFRNGDPELGEEAQEFKTAEEFKQLIVGRLGVLESERYDERMKEFEKAGVQVGVAGKLFKVTSIGKKERATYTLVAFVDLPIKPQPEKPTNPNQLPPNPDDADDVDDFDDNEVVGQDDPNNPNNEEKPTPIELMLPRVVEVRVE